MAMVILAATFVAIAQLLALVAHQRREIDRRRVATLEAANMMERVMMTPWDELTDERLSSWSLSSTAQRSLPDGRLEIAVTRDEQPSAAKRVHVQVDWRNHAGQYDRPVLLVAWKHRTEVEGSP